MRVVSTCMVNMYYNCEINIKISERFGLRELQGNEKMREWMGSVLGGCCYLGEELDAENSGVVSYGSRIDGCSIMRT